VRIVLSKVRLFRQHRLKPPARLAGAKVVAAELLKELLVAVDEALATLDAALGVESPADACSSGQKEKLSLSSCRRMAPSIHQSAHLA
jgi:hypothetical protein